MATRLIEGIAEISEYERLDSGALKVRAIARTPGILTYFDSNGPRRELVTSAFLRSADETGFPIAGQLAKLPVTLEHPPTLLRNDAAKIGQYGVGETTPKVKVYTDGRIQVDMEITDDTAIHAVESEAKRGVSLGYLCDINRRDGVYQGVRYDAEQCAPFTADHLAIVANPRAKEALIQGFERTDSHEDVAVALFEEFTPSHGVNVVDPPRSDSMGTPTAATVAISDIAKSTIPETYQIEINGSPHRVDSSTYEAIQAERLDMAKKVEKIMDDMDDDEDGEDEEYEEKRKDAADQIDQLLARCDANDLSDAIHNIEVLVGRFDGVATVADAVDAIDQVQGRIDALSHEGSNDKRYDSDDVAALLKKLDAATPADALIQLEGKEFVVDYGHMLPPAFKFDGQSLYELQLEALKASEPGLELRSDSEESVAGAFEVIASRNKRVDSSAQLDQALHMDMIHSQPGPGANRPTGTSMMRKPSDSLFSLSKAVRASGSK